MKTRYAAPFVALFASCAATAAPTPQFEAAARPLVVEAEPPPNGAPLEEFVTWALSQRAELRVSLERWRAATARVEAVDELPPLEVMYGFYVSRVETRVGPQRHRARVSQGIPWPGKARRESEARAVSAEVYGVRHDAELVQIRWQVLDAYWRMWALEQEEHWQREHLSIARAMTDSVRGRIEVGMASLADVSQAELLATRNADAIERAQQQRAVVAMELARAVGAPTTTEISIAEPTAGLRVPLESDDELVASAREHPNVRALAAQRNAKLAMARSAGTKRYPDIGLGVEWMETGPALDPSMQDSGKDAVVGTFGLRIPLWSGEVAAAEDALAAEASALEASEEAAQEQAELDVRRVVSELRDSARRVRLYERTLVPQAEAALASVHGAYEVSQTGVTALLYAQNSLLQLRLALSAMRAQHERQWALLERLVARPVPAREVP